MTFSIEISVIILVLRLIISSKFVNDDTLETNTKSKSMNNRIIEMSTTNESLTFRNRLIRKTAKSKSIYLFEITSMKNELLMTKLSIND